MYKCHNQNDTKGEGEHRTYDNEKEKYDDTNDILNNKYCTSRYVISILPRALHEKSLKLLSLNYILDMMMKITLCLNTLLP